MESWVKMKRTKKTAWIVGEIASQSASKLQKYLCFSWFCFGSKSFLFSIYVNSFLMFKCFPLFFHMRKKSHTLRFRSSNKKQVFWDFTLIKNNYVCLPSFLSTCSEILLPELPVDREVEWVYLSAGVPTTSYLVVLYFLGGSINSNISYMISIRYYIGIFSFFK